MALRASAGIEHFSHAKTQKREEMEPDARIRLRVFV
jgi:hypothetical protein